MSPESSQVQKNFIWKLQRKPCKNKTKPISSISRHRVWWGNEAMIAEKSPQQHFECSTNLKAVIPFEIVTWSQTVRLSLSSQIAVTSCPDYYYPLTTYLTLLSCVHCLSLKTTKAWVGGWGAMEKQRLGLLLSSTIPCVFFTCSKKEIAIRRKGRWWVIRQWEGGGKKPQIDR